MTEPEDVIWENTMDAGAWACKVVGILDKARVGELTVTRVADGEVILRRNVGLSYGAIFGPDVEDVYGWEKLCVDAVDSLTEAPHDP